MVGTDSELIDLNSAPEEQQDSVWMNMEEFLSSMFLADDVDEGTSSNEQPGRQCPFNIPKLLRTKTFDEVFSDMINYCDSNDQGQTKNPASPKAFENLTLEDYLARAGVFTDDVQEPPPQQTRYKKGIKERRRLRMLKNRELGAQFRAKKQAYNFQIEDEHLQLEEELYLLREENKHLKLLMKYEDELARAKAAMQAKANEKPATMRRVSSSPR